MRNAHERKDMVKEIMCLRCIEICSILLLWAPSTEHWASVHGMITIIIIISNREEAWKALTINHIFRWMCVPRPMHICLVWFSVSGNLKFISKIYSTWTSVFVVIIEFGVWGQLVGSIITAHFQQKITQSPWMCEQQSAITDQ